MSNLDYLIMLKKSLNIMSVNLVGINMIVMKNKYIPDKVLLQPFIDDEHKISGTIFIEPSKHHNIIIRIKNPQLFEEFTIKSDLAGSVYNYYFHEKDENPGDDKYPCTLHA